ncbi:hypothetical protein H5410_017801, partial [Solanum commersonii]
MNRQCRNIHRPLSAGLGGRRRVKRDVWKERNGRCFEDRSNSIHKVKWNCIVSLLFWCKQLCIDDIDQIIDLIGN